MTPDEVLHDSARSKTDFVSVGAEQISLYDYNIRVLEGLQEVLPEREWTAVALWLSTFFGYQQTWILDQNKFSILVKCRQIGASHAFAAWAVLQALFGEDTAIISVGERESTDVLKKVIKHCGALVAFGSEWAALSAQAITRCTVMAGGSIIALPASSGGRGLSGNLVWDEGAYAEHPEEVWDGAAAVPMHGGKIRVMSTPNGEGNLFWKLWHDPRSNKGFRKHSTTLEQARADGIVINEEECWSMAHGDDRLYRQLFCCDFLAVSDGLVPYALVKASLINDCYTYEGDYYVGLDIGRTADKTVLVVVNKASDELLKVAFIDSCKRTSSDQLESMVDWAFEVYKPRKINIDSTGIGQFPAERMQKKHGKHRVEPVVFTLKSKEELATTLYSAFSEGYLKLPKTNQAICLPYGLPRPMQRPVPLRAAEQLQTDICAIRREITEAGNIRYDAPHTAEGHADSAWALALALRACGKSPGRKHEDTTRSLNARF